MKRNTISLVLSLGLAACSTAYNPLDDYEQVNPATMLESPAANAGQRTSSGPRTENSAR